MSVVLDASAALAIVLEETGADVALASARGSFLSTVNLDEVLHKGIRRAIPPAEIETQLLRLQIAFSRFDVAQSRISSSLHERAHRLGMSFADRACLSLGLATKRPVLTADKKWLALELPIEIRLIR